ncbi:MAG TPA: hypothetical protein DCM23_02845 [Firmicutes bacterium]|jgi:spore coat protein CotH|nr:hypothetical protein [Bacillota bacterium]HAV19670.1 hypothetical protein [Bacillota bacterium]
MNYSRSWGPYDTIESNGIEGVPIAVTIGVENNAIDYHSTYNIKTNKKTSQPHDLVNMIQVLSTSQGLSGQNFVAALEAVIDIDSFLRFVALSSLTGNPDDLRTNVNN